MKLFYRVDPSSYSELMEKVKTQFQMHMETDEEKTILRQEGQSSIEIVVGSFDPSNDDSATVRVVLIDTKLKSTFDLIFGAPFMIK